MRDDNDSHFDSQLGTPAAEYDGSATNYPGGGWLLPSVGAYPHGQYVNGHWLNGTVDAFSASCWYFAQGLAELAAEKLEPKTPIGLISSSWGGTTIEAWTSNETLKLEKCLYAGGNATHDWSGRVR